jgi:hypothetical protein
MLALKTSQPQFHSAIQVIPLLVEAVLILSYGQALLFDNR